LEVLVHRTFEELGVMIEVENQSVASLADADLEVAGDGETIADASFQPRSLAGLLQKELIDSVP
jgi:hypothetical protein